MKALSEAGSSNIAIVTYRYVPSKRTWYALARLDLIDFLNKVEKNEKINLDVRNHIYKNAEQVFQEIQKENPPAVGKIKNIFGKSVEELSTS